MLNLTDESRSDDSDSGLDSSYELDESHVSSLLASTELNDSSGPESSSDDAASVNDPEEECRVFGSFDRDEDKNGMVVATQGRPIIGNNKAVCLPRNACNLHVLIGTYRRPRRYH